MRYETGRSPFKTAGLQNGSDIRIHMLRLLESGLKENIIYVYQLMVQEYHLQLSQTMVLRNRHKL